MTVLIVALLLAATACWPVRSAAHRPFGARAAIAGPTVVTSLSTWLSALRHRLTARGSRGDPAFVEELADLTQLLALCLRAGLPPDQAVQMAFGGRQAPAGEVSRARSAWTEPVRQLLALDDIGAAVPRPADAAHDAAHQPEGLGLLVTAWNLSRERGAPLTEVADTCAGVLRDMAAAARRERVAAAGPRASMALLTALPLAGPLACLVVGVDPASTYGTPVAAASVTVGLTMTAVGWLWSRRLISRARRPMAVG